MAESEIAELCKRIYRKHQRALDLIYEYRPDQQATIREILEKLILESRDFELDHCSKSYIRFAPKAWDNPKLKTGQGWTRSGRILLFEFVNSIDQLKLKLIIGPGPSEIRQNLFDTAQAHKPPFRTSFKSLNQKWNTVFDKTFLTPKDYEDATDEQLGEEISNHWKRLIENDLVAISDILRKEKWI